MEDLKKLKDVMDFDDTYFNLDETMDQRYEKYKACVNDASCFQCGRITVEITYMEGNKTMGDCLQTYISVKKGEVR